MDLFTKNVSVSFGKGISPETPLSFVNDPDYALLLKEHNGGLYFNRSLLIYGFDHPAEFSSFVDMNLLINDKYSSMAGKGLYFGCDVFGNQFGFVDNKVGFLNIEIAEIEILADSFQEWVYVFSESVDYFTGQSLLMKWERQNTPLSENERLCPKLPFIIGGDYKVENLYALDLEKLIDFNGYIASQIHDLPDGTEIRIKVVH